MLVVGFARHGVNWRLINNYIVLLTLRVQCSKLTQCSKVYFLGKYVTVVTVTDSSH